MFHECFTEVLRVFKEVLRVFPWSFYVVSRKIQGCFKEVFRVFQGRLRGDLRISKVQRKGNFKAVSKTF